MVSIRLEDFEMSSRFMDVGINFLVPRIVDGIPMCPQPDCINEKNWTEGYDGVPLELRNGGFSSWCPRCRTTMSIWPTDWPRETPGLALNETRPSPWREWIKRGVERVQRSAEQGKSWSKNRRVSADPRPGERRPAVPPGWREGYW